MNKKKTMTVRELKDFVAGIVPRWGYCGVYVCIHCLKYHELRDKIEHECGIDRENIGTYYVPFNGVRTAQATAPTPSPLQ